MSVAQFSPVLRKRLVEIYSDSTNKVDLASFGKKTRKQLFKEAPETKDIRSKFKAKDFHTASLTLEGMSALTKRLVETLEDTSTKKVVEEFFNSANFFEDFVSYLEGVKAPVKDFRAGDYRLENVPEEFLRNNFIKYIRQNLTGVPKQVIDNIANNVQAGHLASVFFLKLKTALGVKAEFSKDISASYRDFTVSIDGLSDPKALQAIDSILKVVLDADYLTSNLITESQVFIDATKSVLGDNPKLVTELQFKADNEAAGDLLQQTGRRLNQLIQAISKGEMGVAEEAIQTLVGTLRPVVDVVLQKAKELKEPLEFQGIYEQILKNAQFLSNQLINTPGSPTLVEGIGLNIANVIKTGKSLQTSTIKIKPPPIKQKHKEILDISQVAREFEKSAQVLKQAIKKISVKNKQIQVRSKQDINQQSLTGLQTILDANLVEQVKQNMGTGSSTNILNLRSGRFAESVRAEKISQSREGMITVFYSYMKNPYATFSRGGRQEYPRSRDPKLLISKSIRQLLQERVANKLRSVSV
jgi:hypothetical protein